MTDIIVGSRGSGKSTALLKQSAEEQIYILTGTRSQAQCLYNQAREMGLNIPFPVCWDEYMKGHFQGTSIQEDGVLIDEASHLLSRVLKGIPIKTVTWTKYGFRDLDEHMGDKCGNCRNCATRERNRSTVGWKCIAYSFTTHIIEDLLKYDYTLTESQKEAMRLTVEKIKAIDDSLDWEPLS
jgi:hypothetical protein